MSIRAIAWAWDQRCPSPLSKLVLIKICDSANDDGECWPSQARVARDCGMPRETVNRQIKLLIEADLLRSIARITDKGQGVSHYFVRCDAGSHPGVTLDHRPCDAGSHPGVTLDHTEPSEEEPSLNLPPPVLSKDKTSPPSRGGRSFKSEFDEWWEAYPHKVGKGDAERKFKIARKSASADELAEGVSRYIQTKPEDRPWCNPSTWLHQRRWLDQPASSAPNGDASHDDAAREAAIEEALRELERQREQVREND